MYFIKKCLILTIFLLLLLQVTITSADTARTKQSIVNSSMNNSRNAAAELNLRPSPRRSFYLPNNNDHDDIFEQTERSKRDIRNDIFENELQTAVNVFNSQITYLTKPAINSIVSKVDTLNGLRSWLTLSDLNLATNGLNDLNRIATKLPVSIQNCYNSYGFKFSDAINIAKYKSAECLSNKVNEAKSIALDFRNSITNAVANVKDTSQMIAQCQMIADLYPNVAGLVARASCLTNALLSVRSDTALLPLKVATIVGQAFNSITTIQSDMNKCGLEIVNRILDQSIESAKAINSCIGQQKGVTTSTPSSNGSSSTNSITPTLTSNP